MDLVVGWAFDPKIRRFAKWYGLLLAALLSISVLFVWTTGWISLLILLCGLAFGRAFPLFSRRFKELAMENLYGDAFKTDDGQKDIERILRQLTRVLRAKNLDDLVVKAEAAAEDRRRHGELLNTILRCVDLDGAREKVADWRTASENLSLLLSTLGAGNCDDAVRRVQRLTAEQEELPVLRAQARRLEERLEELTGSTQQSLAAAHSASADRLEAAELAVTALEQQLADVTRRLVQADEEKARLLQNCEEAQQTAGETQRSAAAAAETFQARIKSLEQALSESRLAAAESDRKHRRDMQQLSRGLGRFCDTHMRFCRSLLTPPEIFTGRSASIFRRSVERSLERMHTELDQLALPFHLVWLCYQSGHVELAADIVRIFGLHDDAHPAE
jgi:chromosome segregation ATPase